MMMRRSLNVLVVIVLLLPDIDVILMALSYVMHAVERYELL
jgi:hypothetical protein